MIGAKAGGADDFHEFLLAHAATENTLRRGFAPESDPAGTAGAATTGI